MTCTACRAPSDGWPWCFVCSGDAAIASRDAEYAFTLFRALPSSDPGDRVALTLDDLAERLTHPEPQNGRAKQWLPAWTSATFRGNRRAKANVENVDMLTLDIDEPTADPLELVQRARGALGDVEVLAHSTASSAPAAFKLRAFVPLDAPVDVATYEASWALVERVLARAGVVLDPSTKDASHGFFVPVVPPNGVYWYARVAGTPWPARLAALVELERQATRSKRRPSVARAPAHNVIERARRYLSTCEPAIQGANGSRATFVAAAKLVHGFELSEEQAFALLAEEFNPRCVPPWSERDLHRKVVEAAKAREFVRGSLLHGRRAS